MTTAYKVSEVAEKMGVTPSAVYRWINAGELAVIRRGTRFTRVTDRQLAEFLGRYEVPADRRRG